uniref:Uncharacterized protein n=2 Tax=Avena sativa TaxID=4498 RepID=A0ACD5TRV2_AVESA
MGGGAFSAALLAVAALAVLVAAVTGAASEGDPLAGLAAGATGIDAAPEVKSLGPLAKGLLNGLPDGATGPAAMGPVAKYPLVLAEDRTRRPDVLHHLRMYGGGWNITNKHYWASVSFTGVAGFLLAALWFISFGIAAASLCFCKSRMGKGKLSHADVARPVLLVVVVLALIVGCIVLSYGQGEFHEEATKTLDFVVHQSDFTIQTLRNVTDYLSFAMTINVAALYLPSDVQDQINKLKVDLNKASDTISLKTTENYKRIRKVLHNVSVALICIAVLMPVLALLGYVLELYGPRYTIYTFATLCWIIVAALFILIGILLIVRSAAKDTCQAMDEWAQHPRAETALSNILPCVDESTTNRTLYQSKYVVVQLVTLVNRAISALSNRKPYHLHPGQLMPYLCSPYDPNLNDRQCLSREVTFDNATTAWQDYTCNAPDVDACSGPMTVTPEVYGQLVSAANASYALHHYAPLMLNFQDCRFVRDTFSSIASQYCPPLEHDLRLVSAGLALLASGLVLGLLLVLFADRPRIWEEVSEASPRFFRIKPVDSSP